MLQKKFKHTETLKEQYSDHLDSVITHFFLFTETHFEKELSTLAISFFLFLILFLLKYS